MRRLSGFWQIVLKTFILAVLCILADHVSVQAEYLDVANGAPDHLFSQLKRLEGVWDGRSSVGWENRTVYKVIARGSVVMATSEFADEPGEGMATLFHMDGERLILTHYCEAGNVPVLEARLFEKNGTKVTFEFKRSSNLASRDTGHMDKVVFNFLDNNHFTAQWTWYENGKEQWLEEIDYKRIK